MTTTTKIKRHFFYIKKKETISRTYGGSNYTLAIYEIKKKGEVINCGEVSACTRGHKGESSEAWGLIVDKVLTKGEKRILEAANAKNGNTNHLDYYNYTYEEKFGFKLSQF
jgi:hypothetical protein